MRIGGGSDTVAGTAAGILALVGTPSIQGPRERSPLRSTPDSVLPPRIRG